MKISKIYCNYNHQYLNNNQNKTAFGKYKKVQDVELIENNTGRIVKADLKRDKISDDCDFFSVFVKNKEAGFMEVIYNEPFSETEKVIPQITGYKIPEVRRLYSVLGDEYKGIGTTLINKAVKESNKRGENGSLWLEAETGFASHLTKHRKNESPIPFYYKMGFVSPEDEIDIKIRKCLENKQLSELPRFALLILSKEEAKKRYSQECRN